MTGDIPIYNLLNYHIDHVYMNKFAQSVKLDEPTPKVLITNTTHTITNDKDKHGREEFIYSIEVIGTNYLNAVSVAEEIKQLMINFTDDAVYLVVYEGGAYDTNETAEIHRIIKDYRVFTNEANLS